MIDAPTAAPAPQPVSATPWHKKIAVANKIWDRWDKTYNGDTNEKYYLGHQWNEPRDANGNLKYVINVCFPNVEVKLPALMFQRPNITITPRPGIDDDPNTQWDVIAQNLRDLILTCITLDDSGFLEETTLALQETFYRYGVIEVGLSVNPVENPNAQQLMTEQPEEEAAETSPDPDASDEAMEAPASEDTPDMTAAPAPPKLSQMVYYKRVPAKHFRVSGLSRYHGLKNVDWAGYYEYLSCEDIKANPYFDAGARAELEATHNVRNNNEEANAEDEDDTSGLVKIWFIWCNRSKKKYIFADGKETCLKVEDFTCMPLAMLAFHPIMDKAYPLPPMYNWLSPQDELNETREMQRVHRKRAARKFLARRTALTQEDKDKIRSSEDCEVIEVEDINQTIAPMLDAPLDRAVALNVPLTKDDLRYISGVTGEMSGDIDASSTATQTNTVNMNARTRDNYYKAKVAKWLAQIFKLTVEVLRSQSALPIWIKANVDTESPMAMQESALQFEMWRRMNAEEYGSLDFDVHVSVDSLDDSNLNKERQDWMTFLGTVFGEDAMSMIALAPPLLKKTLYLYNIRNGKDIMAIQQAVSMIAAMKAAAAGAEAGGKGDPGSGPNGGDNTQTPPPHPNPQAQNDRQIDRR